MPTRASQAQLVVRPARVARMRFRRAPLAAAAVAFALGIAAGRYSPRPAVLLLAALGLLVALALLSFRLPRVALWPVLGVWVVLGTAAENWQAAPPAPQRLLLLADGLSRTVRGRVLRVRAPAAMPDATSDADPVEPWESAEDTSVERGRPVQVDLAVDALEEVTPDAARMLPASGGVRVSVYGAAPPLACGDLLELPLRLRPPLRFRDPGVFQAADYLLSQGIAAQASVASSQIQQLAAGPAPPACRLHAAQAWAAGRMLAFTRSTPNRRLPGVLRLAPEDAAMLNAMLFGDRGGLTHGLRAGFERTGTFHLFVVSGLHLALLAGGVFWALGRLRTPGWLATVATIAVAAAYAALTGFGQPVQRALAMTAIFLVARLLARDRDPLNALGAAMLAMLVWAPDSLFDPSLQMTVLAVASIGCIAVPLGQWSFLRFARAAGSAFRRHTNLPPAEAQLCLMLELWGETLALLLGRRVLWLPVRRLPARLFVSLFWALELALVGLVAEMVMVLPMALYFHRATLFALPANLLVVPLLALLMPAALMTFAGTLISPAVAAVPAAATALLLHGVRWGISHVSRIEAANLRVPGPVWWVALAAVSAWGVCCWAVRRSGRAAAMVALALPAIALFVLWPEPPLLHPGALELTAIDVGQGDSMLAVAPDGGTMLIDAGGPVGSHGVSEVVSDFDTGEQVVSPYLWSRRLRRLDIVVLTHAHTDHMGGMPAVLQNFRPRELWVSNDSGSALYAALLRQAAALGIAVRHLHAGDTLPWGPVQISVLSPAAAYRNTDAPSNDDSLVLEMRLGKASALLEGDAERPSEEAMLADGRLHPVTLLKIGHHGSRTSSEEPFLAAVAPKDAVISVGRRNTFGHPRGEVVARIAEHGTHLFRTDTLGLTTFLLTSDGRIREQAGGAALPCWWLCSAPATGATR